MTFPLRLVPPVIAIDPGTHRSGYCEYGFEAGTHADDMERTLLVDWPRNDAAVGALTSVLGLHNQVMQATPERLVFPRAVVCIEAVEADYDRTGQGTHFVQTARHAGVFEGVARALGADVRRVPAAEWRQRFTGLGRGRLSANDWRKVVVVAAEARLAAMLGVDLSAHLRANAPEGATAAERDGWTLAKAKDHSADAAAMLLLELVERAHGLASSTHRAVADKMRQSFALPDDVHRQMVTVATARRMRQRTGSAPKRRRP